MDAVLTLRWGMASGLVEFDMCLVLSYPVACRRSAVSSRPLCIELPFAGASCKKSGNPQAKAQPTFPHCQGCARSVPPPKNDPPPPGVDSPFVRPLRPGTTCSRSLTHGNKHSARAILGASGVPMQTRVGKQIMLAPANKRWSRSRARTICPRQPLRLLPTRTRPNLFASD